MNVAKCAHLSVQLIPGRGRLVVSSDARIFIGPTAVACVGAEDALILGLSFGLRGLMLRPLTTCESLSQTCLLPLCSPIRNVGISPLMVLLRISVSMYPGTFLSLTDMTVRKFTKSCVHLPVQT